MLNPEQTEAVKDIVNWLLKPNSPYLILDGPAGTGKSTIISHLANHIFPKLDQAGKLINVAVPYKELYLTATTNKAATVLRPHTYYAAPRTIHSLLGLYVKDKKLARKPNSNFQYNNTLIILDEYSSIGTELFSFIEESRGNNCKVLLVGDSNQLGPVRDTTPKEFASFPKIELKNVVRAENPELLENLDRLVHAIKTGSKVELISNEYVQHFPTANEELKKIFNTDFVQDKNNFNQILTYTNASMHSYNKAIKNLLNQPSTIQVGSKIRIKNCPTQYNLNGISAVVHELPPSASLFNLVNEMGLEKAVQLDYQLTQAAITTEGNKETFIIVLKNPGNFLKVNKELQDSNYRFNEFITDYILGPAMTIHTSQGSTYQNVFVDLEDMSSCRNPDTFRKLLYVALSRAKSRVYLLGSMKSHQGIIL